MGLTILGVGNALPDALTTIALAKKVIKYQIIIRVLLKWVWQVVMQDNFLGY